MDSVCSIQVSCAADEQSVPIPQPETNNEVMQILHDEEQHQPQLLQRGLSGIEAETTQVDELRSDRSHETEKSSWQEQVAKTEVMQSLQDEERQQQQLLQQGFSEIEAEKTEANNELKKSLQDEEQQHQQQQIQEGISKIEAEIIQVDEVCDCPVEATNEVLKTPQDQEQKRQTELYWSVGSSPHEVCDCLMDKRVRILAIYGSEGIGKTTLLTLVHNKFRNAYKDFDVVIWVTVPKASSFKKIQADMWKQLYTYDGEWENKSFDEKATDIFNVLSQKKFLLLLDDLDDTADIGKFGLPLPTRENCSKIVFTTSHESAGGDRCIMMQTLGKSAAWKLFEKKVGEEVLSLDPAIPPIAEGVAFECFGHPLKLNVTARAMANKKTVQEWREALEIIHFKRRAGHRNFILKFGYDNLPNERVKSCFLFCALFPPKFKILKEDLVSYWMCEKFWEDCENGVVVADNEGYHIIDTLVDAGLLEDKGNYVTMHALIRDAALCIGRRSKNLFVETEREGGDQLLAAPEIAQWEGVRMMSMMENNIPYLTEVPVCPNLLTLFLSHNRLLAMIIDGFFQYMKALTILDLSNTSISELPMGISKLVSLQHLNISHTWIEQLPAELQMLSKLKYLNLEYNDLLRWIERQVIASLLRLQVLKIFSCGVSLIHSEDNILSLSNKHVNELQSLENLHTLSITITSSAALQNLLSNLKLQSCIKALSLKCFWRTISLDISLLADIKDFETLEIYLLDSLEELKIDMKIKEAEIQDPGTLYSSAILWERSFNNLQEVTVGKCFCLRELTWVILAPNLKVLKVIDCKEMEEIISINKLGEVPNVVNVNLNPFFNLEVIVLKKLPKLKSVYWNALPFPCLEKFKVVDCPMLKKLPLNSNSATGHVVLFHAQEHWWNHIDWEDNATKIAFLRGFIELLH